MSTVYGCDICKGVMLNHPQMRVRVMETHRETNLDVCPICAEKLRKVFDGDFGYVPPKDRLTHVIEDRNADPIEDPLA